jgi:hypothetical protein
MWIVKNKNEYVFAVVQSTNELNKILSKLSDDLKSGFVITSHYPDKFPFFIIEGFVKGNKTWSSTSTFPNNKDLIKYDSVTVYKISKKYKPLPLGVDIMGKLDHEHFDKENLDKLRTKT